MDFHDKTVLEFGVRAVLLGLTTALLGASRVVLTDIEALLPGLTNNVEANRHGDRVEVRQLVWGSDESSSGFDGFDFDLVLMSDVFFDMEEMAALAKTLKKVCRKETVVWAASEVRPWTGECLNVLVSEGFGVVELPSQLGGSSGSGSGSFMDEDSLDMFAVFLLLPPNENSRVAAICN